MAGLLVGEAGPWFVEQDQARRADDCTSHLYEATLSGAEPDDQMLRLPLEADEPDRVRDVLTASDPRAAGVSWTSRTLSNTERLAIACSFWNVRRSPQRGRLKSVMTAGPPRTPAYAGDGAANPLRTLKKVVLPAPFGPINPQVPSGS